MQTDIVETKAYPTKARYSRETDLILHIMPLSSIYSRCICKEQTKINNFMVQELDGTVNEWVGARRSLVQMLYYQCHLLCATQEHKLKKFFITRRAVTENVPKSVVEINTGGQGPLNNPLSSRLAILNLAIPDFLIAHNLVLARLIKV
nr:hypothetical protein [Tanacetum cinerariifolium]